MDPYLPEAVGQLTLQVEQPCWPLNIITLVPFRVGDSMFKLDGIGPVDNRPSPDKLHYSIQKTHVM